MAAKPNVGPFDVSQTAQWFKFVRGSAVPAQEEAAKPAQDVKG